MPKRKAGYGLSEDAIALKNSQLVYKLGHGR
jgi:hypothetical protein